MNKENILSVYKKLQMARLALVQTTLKKSGRNKFAGYEYFELGDFIPTIHALFDQVGLCGVVSFGEHATLTIYDTEGDGQIVFATPIVMAENAKGQAIQSLGSTHTYLRRYLWLMAMEIVEHDVIDALPQESKPTNVAPNPVVIVPKPVAPVESNFKDREQAQEMLVAMLIEFGKDCKTTAQLTSLWKKNQTEIDLLKSGNEEQYKKLQGHFAEFKLNVKGIDNEKGV
jgi:hypothetical protein